MAIKLKWVNPNTPGTIVEIYRGDAPLDRANLSGIQVTLSAGETSWIDATAVYDRVYYYVFVTKRGADRVVGPNVKVESIERRGAGPNTLRFGNDRLGYFGKLLNSEFFSLSHILAAAKGLTGLPSTTITPEWHKFSRNGKTLYVPSVGFGYASWNDLYNAGLVYGVDGPGPLRGALAPVNQKVVVSLNGEDYLVRLPMGFKNDASDTVDLSAIPTALATAALDMDSAAYINQRVEFNDIVYPVMSPTPLGQKLPNVAQTDPQPSYIEVPVNGNYAKGILCQERIATDFAVMRGYDAYFTDTLPRPRLWLTGIKMTATAGGAAGVAHRANWVPVLELIPTVNV